MATYEELMNSAEQIRTNELPESNTHELVGKHLKNQVEHFNSENQGVKGQITALNKNTGISGYPVWKPNTAYAKGVVILNPDGQLVKNTVEQLDSGGTYNPVLWETTSLDKENREKVAELDNNISIGTTMATYISKDSQVGGIVVLTKADSGISCTNLISVNKKWFSVFNFSFVISGMWSESDLAPSYVFVDDNMTVLSITSGKGEDTINSDKIPDGATYMIANVGKQGKQVKINRLDVVDSGISIDTLLQIVDINKKIASIETDINSYDRNITFVEKSDVIIETFESGFFNKSTTAIADIKFKRAKVDISEYSNDTLLGISFCFSSAWVSVTNEKGNVLWQEQPQDIFEVDLSTLDSPKYLYYCTQKSEYTQYPNNVVYPNANVIIKKGNWYSKYDIIKKIKSLQDDIVNIEDAIGNIEVNTNNQWKGKKIVWMGTSIPWGQFRNSDGSMGDNYPTQIGQKLQCNVVNVARPGMAIETTDEFLAKPFGSFSLTISELEEQGKETTPYQSYENAMLGQDADLYIFDCEPNNSNYELTDLDNFNIQEWRYNDDSDFALHRNTYCGAFIYLLDKLLTEKPSARVCLISEAIYREQMSQDYAGRLASKAIAEKFRIPWIDVSSKLSYNGKNIDEYLHDSVHPLQRTHNIIANILSNELLTVD